MPKKPQPGSDSRPAPISKKTEEIRNRLLSDDGIRGKIAFRAYEIYQRRGGQPGHEMEDWAIAEIDILGPLVEQELKPSRKPPTVKISEPEPREAPVPAAKGSPKEKAIAAKTQKAEAVPVSTPGSIIGKAAEKTQKSEGVPVSPLGSIGGKTPEKPLKTEAVPAKKPKPRS